MRYVIYNNDTKRLLLAYEETDIVVNYPGCITRPALSIDEDTWQDALTNPTIYTVNDPFSLNKHEDFRYDDSKGIG